jgi:hypothetical protein
MAEPTVYTITKMIDKINEIITALHAEGHIEDVSILDLED